MKSIFRTAMVPILIILALATSAAAEPIIGKARIVTGDIIEINRQQIHLYGIAAPAPEQTCIAKGA